MWGDRLFAATARSSSGPGCLPLTEEIRGSNPLRAIRNHSTETSGFLLFYLLFKGTYKTKAQAEAGVRIPYGLSETTRTTRFSYQMQLLQHPHPHGFQ